MAEIYADDEFDEDRETEEQDARQWGRIEELATGENVAHLLSKQQLGDLSRLVCLGFETDKNSRKDWESIVRRGLMILSAKPEKKNTPFEGASNIHFPLLQDALTQFWTRCCSALLSDPQVVKSKVTGPDPDGMKRARARRVETHMSYQKTEASKTWVEDTRALIMHLGATGMGFRKCYWKRDVNNPEADFCSALDVYVDNNASSLESCPRVTHRHPLYPYEVEELMRDGRFRRVELGDDAEAERQDPRWFIEQMLRWDADGDDYAEPWIVTVDEKTKEVVKVLANFRAEDVTRAVETVPMPVIDPETGGPMLDETGEPALEMQDLPVGDVLQIEGAKYWVDFGLMPDPEGKFYKHGLAHLLANLQDAIDTALNQITDAATLQNAGGGFVSSTLKLNERGGTVRRKPGVFHTVNMTGPDIRNAIYHFEDPGPSQALFNVLGLLIETGKSSAMLTDVLTGDAPSQQPATTTLALIEQGMQVFGEIFRGLWESMRKEFRLTAELNALYLSDEAYQMVVDDPSASVRSDYALEDCDVQPIADPRQVTNMQKLARAQFLREHLGMPNINNNAIYIRSFEAAGIEAPEELIVEDQGPPPEVVAAAQAELLKVVSEIAKNMTSALKNVADAEAAEQGANAAEYDMIMRSQPLFQMAAQLLMAMQSGGQNGAGAAQGAQAGGPGQPGVLPGMAVTPGVGMGPGGAPGQRGGAAPGMAAPELANGSGRPNGAYGATGGGGQGGPAF